MTALLHYVAAGTTRPACGEESADAHTTSTVSLVTCGACQQSVTTLHKPTPHGRTNR